MVGWAVFSVRGFGRSNRLPDPLFSSPSRARSGGGPRAGFACMCIYAFPKQLLSTMHEGRTISTIGRVARGIAVLGTRVEVTPSHASC